MLCILRNYPGVDPDIGSFFRDHVFQVWIFFLCVNGFTGVNNTDGCFVSDHLVTHLVNDVCLNQWFLSDQKILRFVQLVQVG